MIQKTITRGNNEGWADGCEPISEAMIELTDNGTKPGVIFSMSSGNNGDLNNWVTHKFTSDDEKLFVICDTTTTAPFEMVGHQVRALHEKEEVHVWMNRLVDNGEEMLAVFDRDKKTMIEDPDTEIGVATLFPVVTNGDTIFHIDFYTPGAGLSVKKAITLRQLCELMKRDGWLTSSIHTCADGVTQKSEIRYTISGLTFRLFENMLLGACFSYPAGTEIRVANFGKGTGTFIKPEGFDYVMASNYDGNINVDACNAANITTGSYCVRDSCTNIFGYKQGAKGNVVNDVHFFSAYGCTSDEQHLPKPEVLAPGGLMLSATNNSYNSYFPEKYGVLSEGIDYKEQPEAAQSLSSKATFDGQDYWYDYNQGTSMAAPVTTGIIALWLQANPNLSVADVREIIAHTATPFISPNEAYDKLRSSRYGIINALEGLKYINANMTSISNICQDSQNNGEAPIYTLDGREVKCRPTPGIYIQGGKKMVILK